MLSTDKQSIDFKASCSDKYEMTPPQIMCNYKPGFVPQQGLAQ